MKYIKLYEANKVEYKKTRKPTYKVGDLVVANLKDFLYNHVGQIVEIGTVHSGQINKRIRKIFKVKYENIPNDIKKSFWKNDFEYGDCYTLYTNEFDKATPEEIARDKYNL